MYSRIAPCFLLMRQRSFFQWQLSGAVRGAKLSFLFFNYSLRSATTYLGAKWRYHALQIRPVRPTSI